MAPQYSLELDLESCGPQLQLAASALNEKFGAEVAFVATETGPVKLRDPDAENVIVWEGTPRVEIPHPEVNAIKLGLLQQHFTYRLASRLNEWIAKAEGALPIENDHTVFPVFAVMPEIPFNRLRWSTEEMQAGFRVSAAVLDPGDGTPGAARIVAADTHTAVPPALLPKFTAPQYVIRPVLVEISGFTPVSDSTRKQIEAIVDGALAEMFGTGFASGMQRKSFKSASGYADFYDGICGETIGAEIDAATGSPADKAKIFDKVKNDFKAAKAKAAPSGDPKLAVLRGIIEKVREDATLEPSARNAAVGSLHPLIGMMRSASGPRVAARITELLPSLPASVTAELETLRDSLTAPQDEARAEGA